MLVTQKEIRAALSAYLRAILDLNEQDRNTKKGTFQGNVGGPGINAQGCH